MSLSLLKFVGQASLVDGLSLSQVFLESISEDGQLAIGGGLPDAGGTAVDSAALA